MYVCMYVCMLQSMVSYLLSSTSDGSKRCDESTYIDIRTAIVTATYPVLNPHDAHANYGNDTFLVFLA